MDATQASTQAKEVFPNFTFSFKHLYVPNSKPKIQLLACTIRPQIRDNKVDKQEEATNITCEDSNCDMEDFFLIILNETKKYLKQKS